MCKRLFFLISVVLVLGLVGNAPAALVGQWTFDDGTASDISGNNHHGTLKSGDETTSISIVYDANMDSNVLDVDNPVDHTLNSVVDCGVGEWTDITEAITLMCWTKLENINVSEDNQYLITHGNAYQFTSNGLQDGIAVYMSEIGGGYMQNILTMTPIMGSWHHVAFTYDASAQSRALYVDGIKVKSDNPYGLMETHTQGFVIGGRLTSQITRGWDGRIDDVRLYDHALSEGEIRTINGVYSAYNPNPGNEAENVSETLPTLTWKPGAKVAATGGHKLYFGTDLALVEVNDVSVYKGALDSNSYSDTPPMGSLALGTTYYWRVIEVNEVNWPGDVWQFSTPPLEATEPDPLDGAKYVGVSRTKVGWRAGITATNHAVYFGTSKALIDANDASVYKGTVNVPDPCEWTIALAANKTYYWRIDVNAPTVYQGDVWSFETMAPTDDPNLVGWWKLDETSPDGKQVFDASGNEHYGSLENSASIVTDYLTGEDVLGLDGIDDFVNISEPADFNFVTDFTWAAWIKTGAERGVIIAKTRGVDDPGAKTFFVRDGILAFDVGYVGRFDDDESRLVNDNEWHHVAVTVEFEPPGTDDTILFYVNGELDAQGQMDVDEYPYDEFPLWIGFDGRADPFEFPGFNGLISDVRIYDRVLSALEIAIIGLKDPNQAWWPYPKNRAVDVVDRPLTLTWRPGVKVAATGGHRVYLGTDKALVDANDASVDYLAQDVNYLDVGELAFATPYYWRVDESNGATTWRGIDWTFTMANFKLWEDFESYDPDPITLTWIRDIATGALVTLGTLDTDHPVNSGSQSMKYQYDNDKPTAYVYYSEAYRDFSSSPQNWSYATGGVKSLRLYFYGETDNYPDDMYVVLEDSNTNDSMKLYDRDLSDLKAGEWKEWDIDLSGFTTVHLGYIKKVYIGFGERGQDMGVATRLNGTVYFDDFRVYPPHCVPDRLKPDGDITENCIVNYEDVDEMVGDWLDYDYTITTPLNPGDANLLGYWNFDDGTANDSSGKNHHGTIVAGGDGTSVSIVYDADRDSNVLDVINVAGVDNAVVDCGGDANDVGDPCWANLTEQVSVAAWFTLEDIHSSNQYMITKGNTWQITSRGTNDGIRTYYEQLDPTSLTTTRTVMDDKWHHIAITYDSTAPARKLYLDGREAGSDEPTGTLNVHWDSFVIGGRLNATYIQRGWVGKIDDVRIYDDALTHEEVVYLITGTTDPAYFEVYSPANLTDAGDPVNSRFVNFKDYDILADNWLTELLWPSGW